MASDKLQKLREELDGLTALELADLVKIKKEDWNISDVAPMMAMPAGGAAAGAAGAEEEKTSFNVVLISTGGNKISVIKEVRSMTSLGLKEAKDLVDAAPKTVKENIPKAEAEEAKKKLEAAGATVELK